VLDQGTYCWRFLSTHLYHQHSSKKEKNYMFPRTYTLLFPLVLELLSSCRNIHQIQVECNKNTLSRKAQKGKGEQWPKTSTTLSQAHSTTDIQTHLAANHTKAEAGGPTPGAGALGARPRPAFCLLGPTSAGGAALKWKLAVRGASGNIPPGTACPRPI
jgi:hypothetical protein